MELPSDSLLSLNSLLPPGFLVEPLAPLELHHRKNEIERLQMDFPFAPQLQQRSAVPPPRSLTSAPKLPVAEGFRRLYLILSKLRKRPESATFQNKEGLSLVSIEARLLHEEYVDAREFAEDLRQMFAQAPPSPANSTLSAYFEAIMTGNEDILLTLRKKPKLIPTVPGLTAEEKYALSEKIKKLDPKYLKGISEIVPTSCNGTDFQIDLNSLQPRAAHGLYEYVEMCLKKSQNLPRPVAPSSAESEPIVMQQIPAPQTAPKEENIMTFLPPIKAPVRLGIAGFHQILPKVFR